MGPLAEALEVCLFAAEDVFVRVHGAFGSAKSLDDRAVAKLRWIDRQVRSLLAKLEAIQEDMTAGLGMAEMGFADPQELQDLLADIGVQIAQMKALGLAVAQGLAR